MQTLKLKSATELIGGIQTPCYGIFCGDHLVRTVSVFGYCETLRIVRRANAVIEQQLTAMMQRGVRVAAAERALELCGKLTNSRARLTKKTLIAANKARKLGN